MKGGKSKAESATRLKPTKKATKKTKDPNKPKRPPRKIILGAVVFMEDFRKTFKEQNPNNKSVAAVGKAGGAKWKSLSDADKAPYVAIVEKRKADYTKNMAAYEKRLAEGGGDDDGSDKSKSEVNDEEEEEDDEDDE